MCRDAVAVGLALIISLIAGWAGEWLDDLPMSSNVKTLTAVVLVMTAVMVIAPMLHAAVRR